MLELVTNVFGGSPSLDIGTVTCFFVFVVVFDGLIEFIKELKRGIR